MYPNNLLNIESEDTAAAHTTNDSHVNLSGNDQITTNQDISRQDGVDMTIVNKFRKQILSRKKLTPTANTTHGAYNIQTHVRQSYLS
jgi:hypothetical protein